MVLKNKIFKGFYYIWVWQPYWSSDLDRLNIISFLHPLKAFHKVWLHFDEIFETVKIRESSVKGQRMNLTSCAHKSSSRHEDDCIYHYLLKFSRLSMKPYILAFSNF